MEYFREEWLPFNGGEFVLVESAPETAIDFWRRKGGNRGEMRPVREKVRARSRKGERVTDMGRNYREIRKHKKVISREISSS